MPDTKPLLEFNEEGVCSACVNHENKKSIDWDKRRIDFEGLLHPNPDKPYDVVVPVSGGKNSIWQVHTALNYGLRVLAVSADYGIKTEIGKYNLNLITEMGADLITVKPSQLRQSKLVRESFIKYGNPDAVQHSILYAYPMWIAIKFGVKLILWAENSAFEYGGDKEESNKSEVDEAWFKKYGMKEEMDIPPFYVFPEKELKENNVKAIFMGHYFCWDSLEHLRVAQGHGLRIGARREGTFRNYEGLDEYGLRVTQFMRGLKFGYGRATDDACEEIRSGRMTRAEGFAMADKYDGEPLTDKYVTPFCKFIKMGKAEFWDIMKKYANPKYCELREDHGLNLKVTRI